MTGVPGQALTLGGGRDPKTKFAYADGAIYKEIEPGTNSPIPQLPTEESRSTRAEKKPVDEFIGQQVVLKC